jgi:flagellar biosynthesis chaperone FliJ
MNAARRAAITEILVTLERAKSDLDTIRDEEQEYYDNMPESIQGGLKGDAAQEAISALENVISSLEDAVSELGGVQ